MNCSANDGDVRSSHPCSSAGPSQLGHSSLIMRIIEFLRLLNFETITLRRIALSVFSYISSVAKHGGFSTGNHAWIEIFACVSPSQPFSSFLFLSLRSETNNRP